ncbi:MAG: hypothetical protein J6M34_05425 [Clostridia bacterium]|nr:hypothetical protein [Clostridia bacterium]
MNHFFKLLNYFNRGEQISRQFLLRKPGITKALIDAAIDEGYIVEVSSDNGDVKYTITSSGINKRDK